MQYSCDLICLQLEMKHRQYRIALARYVGSGQTERTAGVKSKGADSSKELSPSTLEQSPSQCYLAQRTDCQRLAGCSNVGCCQVKLVFGRERPEIGLAWFGKLLICNISSTGPCWQLEWQAVQRMKAFPPLFTATSGTDEARYLDS